MRVIDEIAQCNHQGTQFSKNEAKGVGVGEWTCVDCYYANDFIFIEIIENKSKLNSRQ